jgi:hypothetical protein
MNLLEVQISNMRLSMSSNEKLRDSIRSILSESKSDEIFSDLISVILPRLQAFPGIGLKLYEFNLLFNSNLHFSDLIMDADTFCNILNFISEERNSRLHAYYYDSFDRPFYFVLKSSMSGKYILVKIRYSPGQEPHEEVTKGLQITSELLTQEEIMKKYLHCFLILDPDEAGSL